MTSLVFDTHVFVKKLTAAGMPEPQAEVLAEQQTELIEQRLASKQDLEHLATERGLAETKSDILKWVFAALTAQTAIIAALVKLL